MPTPKKHALLSVSSSGRWLNCTAAPRFEEQFPEKEASVYAEEGTLAHKFCETIAAYNFHHINKRTFTVRWNKLQKEELFQPEMIKTAEFYANYLWEKYLAFGSKPFTALEDEVDLTDYIPEGFGTCDSVIIGGNRLHITDYKHGKGVPVSAKFNSQMRLYALGALKKYRAIFGDAIQVVSMAIVQPRITEDVEEDELTVEELLQWGDSIKPIAQKAFSNEGEFHSGPWCKFCKGKAVCRARSENATALEDFKGVAIEGRLTEQERIERNTQQVITGSASPMLSDEEVADLIRRGESLVAWYEDLKNYALQAIMDGRTIPGFKVVAGKSNRAFSDQDKALGAIVAAGYDEAVLYERKAKSLTELEKMIGKKAFENIVGALIVKPVGKPTLADEKDKRPDYSEAVRDFKDVAAAAANAGGKDNAE